MTRRKKRNTETSSTAGLAECRQLRTTIDKTQQSVPVVARKHRGNATVAEEVLPRQKGAKILHEQHQVHRIDGCGFEIELQVEPSGVLVNGMDEQSADANGISSLRGSYQRIEQQSLSEALALLLVIDRKAAQESKADRVIGETLDHSRRGIVAADAAGSERVIPDDEIISTMRDVDLSCVGQLVLPREPLQPFVQGRGAAIKRRQVVNLRQSFNDKLGL